MTERPSTWLALLADLDPDAPAVVDDGADGEAVTWTLRELLAAAGATARWLDERGAPTGAVVPAFTPTSAPAIALILAGMATHRPVAPLNPLFTGAEREAILARLEPGLVVEDGDLPPFDPSGPAIVLDQADPAETGFVLHTSGTTGLPKRVNASQGRLVTRAVVNSALLGLGPGTSYSTTSGLHHIAGLGGVVVCLAAGATLLVTPRFSEVGWSRFVEERRPSHLFLVPTMIERLLDADLLTLPGVRVLHYGGSPMSPTTLGRLVVEHPSVDLVSIYGQTEGSPLTALTADDHRLAGAGRPELLASVGRAAGASELRIDGDDGTGVGEVLVRAGHLFSPGPDGWLRTGDLGRLDDDGYLYLAGRVGDTIIRGGENVQPQEVERVLGEHPAVKEAAVIGVPDRVLGQSIRAFVVAVDDPCDPEELRAFARSRMAGFKVPASWVFVDELPRNVNGKVLKRQLAEHGGPEGGGGSGS